MSLLDPIAVCDAVLETVMQQDVHIAIRTDNPGNATPIGSGTVSNPYGGPENAGYTTLVIRKNVIREIAHGANSITGIYLSQCNSVDVQSNLIDHASITNSVRWISCYFSSFFDNRNTVGQELGAFNPSAGTFANQWDTNIQNVLLAI
jgi:hypothetical protein